MLSKDENESTEVLSSYQQNILVLGSTSSWGILQSSHISSRATEGFTKPFNPKGVSPHNTCKQDFVV